MTMPAELLLKTSGVLAAAWFVAALLRSAASSTRHLVWQIAIIVTLLAPLLVPIVPRVPVIPPVGFQTVSVPDVPVIAHPTTNAEPLEPRWNDARGTFGTLGTLGTLVVASWFLFCWLLSGVSVWRGSKPAPEIWLNEAKTIGRRIGLKYSVEVRQLRKDASPHVAGFFRSIVMLPPSAMSWTAEARHAALVHELTHIKRHDRLTQALAQLACALYWFNPLVWHAAGALARERERACDDEVLRLGATPSTYATLLLDIARSAQNAWTPAAALSMARPSAIEGRLLSILADVARAPRRSTRWLVTFGILAITVTILGAQGVQPSPTPLRPLIKPTQVMALDEQKSTSAIVGSLVAALRDDDRQVREQAAIGLAITPGSDVVEPLLNALKDPDAQVREKAAIGLAFRRDPKIVDPLLTAINDDDSHVREKAAIALGASGDTRAVDALTRAMKDPDSHVREKAVAGLVLLGLKQ